jgi:hypothetical protein
MAAHTRRSCDDVGEVDAPASVRSENSSMEYRVRFVGLRENAEELQVEIENVCNKLGIEGYRLVHTETSLHGVLNGIYLFFERH